MGWPDFNQVRDREQFAEALRIAKRDAWYEGYRACRQDTLLDTVSPNPFVLDVAETDVGSTPPNGA